jgi:hypothetical protein
MYHIKYYTPEEKFLIYLLAGWGIGAAGGRVSGDNTCGGSGCRLYGGGCSYLLIGHFVTYADKNGTTHVSPGGEVKTIARTRAAVICKALLPRLTLSTFSYHGMIHSRF